MLFELTDRDAAGRIGKLKIGAHKIKTPNIAIVINPNKMIVPIKDLKKMGVEIIITNSYIIKNSPLADEIAKKGLHKFFGWEGPIYTDSGTYQMYSQKVKDISQKQILDFQKKIGSDIITPVDIFTTPFDSRIVARKNLEETAKRIKSARKTVKTDLVGPIQGGNFPDLRKKACKETAKFNPDIFAIGGIVPYMESYRFTELCETIITCKQNLPANKPVHAFGAGHPMVFSLLVACGCDLFDSALYSLAAKRGAYLTANGTLQLESITEFPCSCPVCEKITPSEVKKLQNQEKQEFLAKHNLFSILEEMRTVRNAITNNRLWELVQQRSSANPRLFEALITILKKYNSYFIEKDIFGKKPAFVYSNEASKYRPEVLNAKERIKGIKSKKYFKKEPFGKTPYELFFVYPFYQSIVPFQDIKKRVKTDDKQVVKAVLDYQFGKGKSKLIKDFEVEKSRKTGVIRHIYSKGKLIGTARPRDGFLLPSVYGAQLLKIKKVLIKDKDVAVLVGKGRDLMAKFVSKSGKILPGEEVAVSDGKKVIAVGRALLNRKEMKDFDYGVAVKVRNRRK